MVETFYKIKLFQIDVSKLDWQMIQRPQSELEPSNDPYLLLFTIKTKFNIN